MRRHHLALLLLAVSVQLVHAQQTGPSIRDTYRKYEYMIPMRDGAKLYTAVYVPKNSGSTRSPILLERTPYSAGPYGPDAYKGGFRGSAKMRENKYIFAYQDVRGRYMSEGEFVNVRPQLAKKGGPKDIDESTDTYDTIDYLVKNVPGNNGNVGLWGISYPGFYAAAGAINSHPALKAASPQAPVSDWFIGDDMHHHGVFFLQDCLMFFSRFGQPRPAPSPTGTERGPTIDLGGDAYKFFLELGALKNVNPKILNNRVAFWNECMEHPNYDDFWQARSLPNKMTGINCAVMTVGGFFDAEDCWGALAIYKHTEKQNRGIENTLVMGPWYHGMWASGSGQRFGDQDFGTNTSRFYQDEVEFPWFDYHLRGGTDPELPEIIVFETGSNRWQKYGQWPPSGSRVRPIYFEAGKALTFAKPETELSSARDSYVSDPASPVPYQGGTLTRRTREYMIDDQRFASTRPDVLTYSTPVLDKDLRIAGPITADLFVQCSNTDLDMVVKVIDVFPDNTPARGEKQMAGYQMLVRADIFRSRFRNSYTLPIAMDPKKVARVTFALPDSMHTFKKGHRLMIQVQSSWFPLADRNPQQFVDIYKADDSDFIKATVSLLRTAKYPSSVKFTTVE